MTGHEIVVGARKDVAQGGGFGDYAGMLDLAAQLVTTGFLPPAIKTPAQALAIILTGQELGLGPMQSLRSIYIVQQKPALSADLQLALFKKNGGHARFETLTDERAVLWLKHPNGDEHTETFTMKDAASAGVTGNPTWKKFPKAMLRSRAITAGLKSVGFEPTTGVYDPEELGQEIEVVPLEGDGQFIGNLEQPSKARGAGNASGNPQTTADAGGPSHPPTRPTPAPMGGFDTEKRIQLSQKNINRLIEQAGSKEALSGCLSRALGDIVENIADAAAWPKINAEEYNAVVREIDLAKMPPAIAEEEAALTPGPDTRDAAQQRQAIYDAANERFMPPGKLRTAVYAHTKGSPSETMDLNEVSDHNQLLAIFQAVEAWSA